jgi:hypothetical protein
LRYGLYGVTSVEDAAHELAGLAEGDARLIELAISRIEVGLAHDSGPVASFARDALTRALSTVTQTPGVAATG